jgi:hypothetical protein
MKEIIIVSYKFCPRGRIGTRRWSKFAKYLSSDYKVHVVCANYQVRDKVNWCHDVEDNPNIVIHRLPGRFPLFADGGTRSFVVKASYAILRQFIYFVDEAQFWRGPLLRKVTALLKGTSATTVIVTGAPFSPMHHLSKLRRNHPDLNLIMDFRDPWSLQEGSNDYHKILGGFKRRIEEKMERRAIDAASTVLQISEDLRTLYQKAYPNYSNKIKALYNGYDPVDFLQDNVSQGPPVVDVVRIAYAGALHRARYESMLYLVNQFQVNDYEFWRHRLQIVVYSNQVKQQDGNNLVDNKLFDEVVEFHPAMPQSDLFTALKRCDVLLSINDRFNAFAFGTKFFEYLALRRPIMLVAPDGEQSSLLRTHNQYVANYEPGDAQEMINSFKESVLNNTLIPADGLREQFSLHSIVEVLKSYVH